jgi:ribokinase
LSTVYVVGSLNMDQRIQVPALPRAGETVTGQDAVFNPGGKGGNQAVAAARAGAAVSFVGAVGSDDHGLALLAALATDGIDCRNVRTEPGKPTGTAIIPVDPHGQNSILVCPGANSALTREDVSAGLVGVGPGDVVVLQLEVNPAVVRHAAAVGRERDAIVILNAAPAPASTDRLFDNVDVLLVNDHELEAVGDLMGVPPGGNPARTRDLSAKLGITVICTVGPDGAYAAAGGKLLHQPARKVDAVDTTGAGDTFVGYLAACLARNPAELAAALAQAASAAACAVTRPGAMESIPRLTELFVCSR